MPIAGASEQWGQVERIRGRVAGAALAQALDAPDRVVESAGSRGREQLAHLLCDEAAGRPRPFGRAGELRPQLGRCVAIPTGHVSRWHDRTMMQPSASSGAVPNEYSSAPSSAATMTSRPVLKPPSTRRRTRPRRPFATSACWVSARPSSHGRAGVLDRRAAGSRRCRRWRRRYGSTSACALATPAATSRRRSRRRASPRSRRRGFTSPQVEDQLRQVLDRVDVVVRRRRDQRRRRAACCAGARSPRSPCAPGSGRLRRASSPARP